MKVLPVGRFDYDLFPLTEEFIEINEDGSETVSQIEKIGVIEIGERDLEAIHVTKRFNSMLDGVEDMTAEEIAEATAMRRNDIAVIEARELQEQLTALDRYTHLWVEGKLSSPEWATVVGQRDTLRQRIAELQAKYSSERG